MTISAQSIGEQRDSRSQKIPIRDGWDALVEDFSASSPPGLENVF